MRSKTTNRGIMALGLLLLAGATPPDAAWGRQNQGVPTMTNSSLDPQPEPLPEGWPVGATDVQVRGAVCEDGYGKDGGRKNANAGDDVLPMLRKVPQGFDQLYLGVRHIPFVGRRDVESATFHAVEKAPNTYEVRLKLTEDGAKKVQEFTAANVGQCVALVAAGKVLWYAPLESPVEGDVFVLAGSFSAAEALGIADLFNAQ
jgi:hypothetical protein